MKWPLLLVGALGALVGARALREDDETLEIQSCLSPELKDEERGSCRFYAVVIDAGSTGTRVHVFEFSHDLRVLYSPFRLEHETFHEVKPGLSAFVGAPERAAQSVAGLLATARAAIPPALCAHTPVTLKATAGLRLLTDEDANEILRQVEMTVLNSGFLVDENSVGILNGVDEGIFGWFTLNYLLERLGDAADGCEASVDFIKTGAALDLGGGSTQITFVPNDLLKTLRHLPADKYSHRLRLFGRDVDFFTHSYLGNGLIAARLGIAKLTTHEFSLTEERDVLQTYCLPVGYQLTNWEYAGSRWNILPVSEKPSSFDSCLASARRYVEEVSGVVPIVELNDAQLYAFAYFRDRAVQASLWTTANDGRIRVVDYRHAAEKACALKASELGDEHWRPWQCMDLVYIYALLRYGYGLLDEKQIHLTKKLKEKEVSWALGAGYHLLNTYHERKRQQAEEDNRTTCTNGGAGPPTCSLRAWYLRVGLDGANISDVKMAGGDGTAPTSDGCLFMQLRDYVSEAASQILVLFKLKF